jgi:hypothetical protein
MPPRYLYDYYPWIGPSGWNRCCDGYYGCGPYGPYGFYGPYGGYGSYGGYYDNPYLSPLALGTLALTNRPSWRY